MIPARAIMPIIDVAVKNAPVIAWAGNMPTNVRGIGAMITNGIVNEVFFETILTLLKGNVSVVIEAAFQHKLWDLVVPRINEIALASVVICALNAELSAGHTYTFGGDVERVTPRVTGFLGIDWELNNDLYRIKRIVTPAIWDTEIRSPFDQPGVDVNVGDCIL